MKHKLLFIDDEPDFLKVLKSYFNYGPFEAHTASSAEEGIKLIDHIPFDAVVSDMSMPGGMGGLELIKVIRSTTPHLPIVIMTGVGTIESAVEAIQQGAFHYITKPFAPGDLEITIKRAVENGEMHRKLAMREEAACEDDLIIGSSRQMQDVMATIAKVSASNAPIMLLGETGTGKSRVAGAVHKKSQRHGKPFLTIDCAALTETLLESELFGHVKGAFTGASSAKRGLLEEAHGGTVFLDEIGELSAATQVKLLRAVQEQEIKPVGGNRSVKIDVRFISATSRNLEQEIEEKRFRKDLYFRLAVIPLNLPALRERPFDISLFAAHFLKQFNRRYRKEVTRIEPATLQMLQAAPWKGNIRELENAMERAVLLAEEEIVTRDLLAFSTPAKEIDAPMDARYGRTLKEATEEAERVAIRQALELTEGNRSQAARTLGIGRRTLYDKMEHYDIQ